MIDGNDGTAGVAGDQGERPEIALRMRQPVTVAETICDERPFCNDLAASKATTEELISK